MAVAAAPCEQPGIEPCFGCVQAAREVLPTDGHCGCRSHYVPGQGLVVAYRCAYHAGQQEDGAEEWQGCDDPNEQPHVGFDVDEYHPGLDGRHWDVGDSNEKTRKEFDRRRATAAAKDPCAKEANEWMLTSERSMLPAYVVLFTLISCMLIAVAVVNILSSDEEDVSTTSIPGVPFLTRPKGRVPVVEFTTTIDNSSYSTDVY
ncbi:hypothetical protein HPB52_017946 [Rhipicephalus sanguineus]|uniref:Uncharacterized protein n=2 Tax=Rhipicephalus sanguineus TaxID=34632 RepID=A0A9D4PSF3_RHISA|nr:hypothetical protein HPB52_017946 [Rhipicephalus sanguineus]